MRRLRSSSYRTRDVRRNNTRTSSRPLLVVLNCLRHALGIPRWRKQRLNERRSTESPIGAHQWAHSALVEASISKCPVHLAWCCKHHARVWALEAGWAELLLPIDACVAREAGPYVKGKVAEEACAEILYGFINEAGAIHPRRARRRHL